MFPFITTPRTTIFLSAFLFFAMSGFPHAHADETVTPSDIHTPSEEAVVTRKHRMKKLEEHLSLDAEALPRRCRFESDIAEVPPEKRVVLTFDDGPEPGQTEYILSVLKKYNVPAAFFMIGEKVRAHPELVDLVRGSGNALIGNHSWSHPNFHDIPAAEQAMEVGKTSALLTKAVEEKYFRYPYGNSSCETNELLKSLNYKIVGWHVDTCDWAFDHKGVVDEKEALSCGVLPQNRENFFDHVISSVRAHNGGIILMHEIHPNTLKQLDKLVAKLLADGYIIGKLNNAEFSRYLR
ncbi:MAG: polysaccharide deacetylase family protein [Pseudomonadota bacterium]